MQHQPLLLPVFLILSILLGVRWYPVVVWICISLTANDVEHLFVRLLAIHMSSLVKCSKLLPIFLLNCLSFIIEL